MRLPWQKAKTEEKIPADVAGAENGPHIVTGPVPGGDYTRSLPEVEKAAAIDAHDTSFTATEHSVNNDTVADQRPATGTERVVQENTAEHSHKEEAAPTLESHEDRAADDSNLAEKPAALERSATATTAASSPDDPEDESKYPTGLKLVLLTVGLCLGTFVVALDNTIIATAIPHITTVFNSLDDIGWYGSAYLLTTASLQPSLGKVYVFFSIKNTYIISVAIFELGSVLCGAATSSKMLIVGRAVAGAGASGIFSGAITIVGYLVPLRKRTIYIATVSSMFGFASVVGPTIGGAFTDKVSWRWCFYINLPVGALCIFSVVFFFSNPERKESKLTLKQKAKELDLPGAFLLIGAVVCLLLALQWGGSTKPWNDPSVYGCFIGFGLIISLFLGLQAYLGDRATLPPRILLKQRSVLATAIFSFFLSMSLYILIYYMPIWFQSILDVSAEASGIRTIPFLVSSIFAAIPVGAAVSKVGYYTPFIWCGSALFPIGAGLLSTLKINSGAGKWIGYQLISGISAGACVQLPFVAVQVVLNKRDMPVGNAVAVFFNSMGGAIGVSIAQNVFSNALKSEIPKYAPNAPLAAIIASGATHFRDVTSAEDLHGVLLGYNAAVTRTFIIPIATSILAFLSGFLFEMKSVKGKALTPGGAA